MHMSKQKAAGLGNRGRLLAAGEAFAVPHEYSTRSEPALQEPICVRTDRAYEEARRLAIHHAALAERFITEAEALKDLARALKSEAP